MGIRAPATASANAPVLTVGRARLPPAAEAAAANKLRQQQEEQQQQQQQQQQPASPPPAAVEAAAPPPPPRSAHFNDLLLRTTAAHQRGDLAAAEHALRAALRCPEAQTAAAAAAAPAAAAHTAAAAHNAAAAHTAAALQNDLGAILQMAHRLPESVAAFNAALGLRPGYLEAINNLGVVLQVLTY